MVQEEKQLLLKDLSARLPYGVKVLCKYFPDYGEEPIENVFTLNEIDTRLMTNPYWIGGEQIQGKGFSNSTVDFAVCIDDEDVQFIKPCLRPMSSMTEEEENEFISLNAVPSPCQLPNHTRMSWYSNATMLDWLNAHHFDYRGLIEKRLALEAPDGMYNRP